MTLEDVKAMERDAITPAIAAQVLGCDPHWIRAAAHQDRSLLGFPVVVLNSRIKIPRMAFIRFMEGNHEADDP